MLDHWLPVEGMQSTSQVGDGSGPTVGSHGATQMAHHPFDVDGMLGVPGHDLHVKIERTSDSESLVERGLISTAIATDRPRRRLQRLPYSHLPGCRAQPHRRTLGDDSDHTAGAQQSGGGLERGAAACTPGRSRRYFA